MLAFLGIMLIPALLSVRLFYLQVIEKRTFTTRAMTQVLGKRDLPVSRSEIRDRNNQVLALNMEVDSLAINPRVVEDQYGASFALAKVLSMDPAEVRNRLRNRVRGQKALIVHQAPAGPRELQQLYSGAGNGLDQVVVNGEPGEKGEFVDLIGDVRRPQNHVMAHIAGDFAFNLGDSRPAG